MTVSDSQGRVLASGRRVFYNNNIVTKATNMAELKAALSNSFAAYITLETDMDFTLGAKETLDVLPNKIINLNGKTLSCPTNGQSIMTIKEGNVTILNGKIEFNNTFIRGNYADIVVGVDKSQSTSDSSDEVVSVATLTLENVTLSGTIRVSYGSNVIVKDSEVTSELYGICSNPARAKKSTEPISVTIINTKLIGETPVFIAVPAMLTMDNCNIIGGWQGVVMRGGEAVIRNSTISLEEKYAESVEGTRWLKDRRSGSAWSNGNEVAVAGITMGNNTTGAYQYPTKVTLENTSVSGYDGYWAVYADATSVCTVDFTYDNACTFSPELNAAKSFQQGVGKGNDYITVTDGDGVETKY